MWAKQIFIFDISLEFNYAASIQWNALYFFPLFVFLQIKFENGWKTFGLTRYFPVVF